jgi:syntaxin-binding protein 5
VRLIKVLAPHIIHRVSHELIAIADPACEIRLIAVRESGHSHIYTFMHSSYLQTGRDVRDTLEEADGMFHPFSETFVLDSKTGRRRKLDRRGVGLTETRRGISDSAKGDRKHCVWICAGSKGVKSVLDINGSRIAKVDWPSAAKSGTVESVQVVERLGALCMCVVDVDLL